ncbi:bifunctional metallophosphatase/5'-nucleotidase [Aquiflexum lacus]|uniref:bifunctional metallophosphatase/5'-nucleotidase n=1 Tax=Aquiflexum lacus TaxID=2483805 RepID=UPI001892F376|nr:metallophosphoesterase [Aquiflexum lacus]
MERRDFLRKSILTGSALTLGSGLLSTELIAGGDGKRITILHTNDIHSRIEPFPKDSSRNANQGGLTRLGSLVKKIREKESNILLLDAGDVFQGTPYFNFFGGELEYNLMNKIGFDATTLGNHEFDNGLKGIFDQLPNAEFSHLIANYDFSKTILNGALKPYKIFKKGGLKIGVFGLGIELKGLVAEKSFEQTKYLDPVPVAKEMVRELRNKNCDLVICLSHLGFTYRSDKIDDLKLAHQVDEIDLIIGGHTHSFLDQPVSVKSSQGYDTIVNQVGTAALRLGMLDYEFSKKNKIKNVLAKNMAVK